MKIVLFMLGKTKEAYLQIGIEEYTKRLSRYVPFQPVLLPDVKNAKNLTEELLKQSEGKQFFKNIKETDYVILLDEKGKTVTSEGFADQLQKLDGRVNQLVFVIGGAFGFSESMYQRADMKLSLSSMTFSHQMVRLIFLEQLYRAFTIQRGEPYHHK